MKGPQLTTAELLAKPSFLVRLAPRIVKPFPSACGLPLLLPDKSFS